MLVLTRKPDQSIMIGNDIEITVLEVRGEQVRIGIRAPRHIAVHRKEVFEQIRQENQKSELTSPSLVAEVERQLLTANGNKRE